MKFLFLGCILFICFKAFCQNSGITFYTSINYSLYHNINNDEYPLGFTKDQYENLPQINPAFGFLWKVEKEKIEIETGIGYIGKGQSFKLFYYIPLLNRQINDTMISSLHFISIPLGLNRTLVNNPKSQIQLSFSVILSYLFAANDNYLATLPWLVGDLKEPYDRYKKFELSCKFGIGYNIHLFKKHKLGFFPNIQYGITPVTKSENTLGFYENLKTAHTLLVGISTKYYFPIK